MFQQKVRFFRGFFISGRSVAFPAGVFLGSLPGSPATCGMAISSAAWLNILMAIFVRFFSLRGKDQKPPIVRLKIVKKEPKNPSVFRVKIVEKNHGGPK